MLIFVPGPLSGDLLQKNWAYREIHAVFPALNGRWLDSHTNGNPSNLTTKLHPLFAPAPTPSLAALLFIDASTDSDLPHLLSFHHVNHLLVLPFVGALPGLINNHYSIYVLRYV